MRVKKDNDLLEEKLKREEQQTKILTEKLEKVQLRLIQEERQHDELKLKCESLTKQSQI